VNEGVRAARGEHLLVLNDDVRLDRGTVGALLERLSDRDVFAVVPAIRSPLAACGDEGGKWGSWRAGELELRETVPAAVQPSLYPVGCCFLCLRRDFLDLGGYDELLAPFFWEDVDLGYRAWRRGRATLHVPDAVCDHEGSATLKEAHTAESRERAFARNRVLFHLRNLRDPELRAESLGALAARALFDAGPALQEALAEALGVFARAGRRTEPGLADREILARSAPR
jgi:GT2 family glycosyltransferase